MKQFAVEHDIPLARFKKGGRRIYVMCPRIGAGTPRVAQVFQNVFASGRSAGSDGIPWFMFTKSDRRVSCFYFYLFGAEFIKICIYHSSLCSYRVVS